MSEALKPAVGATREQIAALGSGVVSAPAAKLTIWGRALDVVQPWIERLGLDKGKARLVAALVLLAVPGGLCLWLFWRLVRRKKA